MPMSEASLSPLYFNKTLLHKSSERSSLVSGPRLNSSPPEAKNPTSHRSATTFHLGGLSGILQDKALTEFRETTPDPASESSKPLFEPGTGVLIKTLGSGGPLLEPLWEGPYQMGLTIYVSLLLLTPEILSLPFDPQNAFLSWAHSYAAFHNRSNCWVCGPLPSSPWKASHGGRLHFKERTFSKSANTFNNRMWCLFLNWWHLTTLKWTGAILCTLTMDKRDF